MAWGVEHLLYVCFFSFPFFPSSPLSFCLSVRLDGADARFILDHSGPDNGEPLPVCDLVGSRTHHLLQRRLRSYGGDKHPALFGRRALLPGARFGISESSFLFFSSPPPFPFRLPRRFGFEKEREVLRLMLTQCGI